MCSAHQEQLASLEGSHDALETSHSAIVTSYTNLESSHQDDMRNMTGTKNQKIIKDIGKAIFSIVKSFCCLYAIKFHVVLNFVDFDMTAKLADMLECNQISCCFFVDFDMTAKLADMLECNQKQDDKIQTLIIVIAIIGSLLVLFVLFMVIFYNKMNGRFSKISAAETKYVADNNNASSSNEAAADSNEQPAA
jgi:hypothetical protein